MRILMVSMLNYHFVRWTEQLKESGHEIFWFDINDNGNKVEKLSWLHQKVGWKLRYDFPFRVFVKSEFPALYKWIQKYNERKVQDEFEKYLLEVKPDVVHSFAIYISCFPIVTIMNKYPDVKWVYSSWGSDLFDFQNYPDELKAIKEVLPRVNYLFTDCFRDYEIAKKHGFVNTFLGVFPGGGGYFLDKMEDITMATERKNSILIKGFQGRWGRAINILKAIIDIKEELKSFPIVIFGADDEIISFVKNSKLSNWKNITVLGKIQHDEVLYVMGESFLYIGNSISDGMPNTMLEAICMNVFPIQSNPGGVTQELIEDGFNGLLIEDSENIENLRNLILRALNNEEMIKNGIAYNSLHIAKRFDYDFVRNKVLQSYMNLAQDN
ncbi:Glycosyltransferase involved in cell wall bisynthesis [Flavobacterium gillisiae]|uniref:Glycosyltransferase involved in cell wall bisynthesis n=1 Tax=Flavobacterium gillisiae TaxID=150146 RepID=A0A1H4EVI7_9FLAO|nr:glycosyltransferase family 4 protein [Flavobacterium gillisiae]SEA89044.1 Glycosyltransferase involved in cell wall bisynthesis [Flavobacterium gillisiae]